MNEISLHAIGCVLCSMDIRRGEFEVLGPAVKNPYSIERQNMEAIIKLNVFNCKLEKTITEDTKL